MTNEAVKRIAELLKTFNLTFDFEAKVIEEEEEESSVELRIKGLKNDGADFIRILHETFNDIVQVSSSEHEVIYHPAKGLAVAKKVVKTDYIIEEFE